MSVILRVILIICSILSFITYPFFIRRIKQAKIKVTNSVIWLLGSLILVLMSIFSNAVEWISAKLGFIAPVNFVFFIMIVFLLIQVFIDNIRITELNEKIKELDHYIALKEHDNKNKI